MKAGVVKLIPGTCRDLSTYNRGAVVGIPVDAIIP